LDKADPIILLIWKWHEVKQVWLKIFNQFNDTKIKGAKIKNEYKNVNYDELGAF